MSSSSSMNRLALTVLVLLAIIGPIRAARFESVHYGNPSLPRARHAPYSAMRARPRGATRSFVQIQYKVIDNSTAPGNSRFESEIGKNNAQMAVMLCSGFVFNELGISPRFGKAYTTVTLIVESFRDAGIEVYPNEVASTVDNFIRLNTEYIQSFNGDVLREFKGIMYHESTHVWQWTGNGQAPEGLVNGIADYVRLKAGYPAVTWGERGSGDSWDQGYEVTAYFLEFCEELKPGFVSQLNAMMKDAYSESFFDKLLGKSVDEVWNEYKFVYGVIPSLVPPVSSPPAMPPAEAGN